MNTFEYNFDNPEENKVISRANEIYVELNPDCHILNNVLIPQFYHRIPCDDQPLKKRVRDESRSQFLAQMTNLNIPDKVISDLYDTLQDHQSRTKFHGQSMIDYLRFSKIRQTVNPLLRHFFTAKNYAGLYRRDDPYCRLSIKDFFNFVMRYRWMMQTRVGLSLYDLKGLGVILESEFENYIMDLIPTLCMLNSLDTSFTNFYVVSVVRRFFFFLDTQRTARLKINKILKCEYFKDLLELRDKNLSLNAQNMNWFSMRKSLAVYGIYLSLDLNGNGMLSKDELSRYDNGKFTPGFMDQMFSELLTYDKEIDYKNYLDFVLAVENINTYASMKYMFRIIDTKNRNYIDAYDLNYFFRYILEVIKRDNNETVDFDDFKSELFDMVQPKDPSRITFQDILNSKRGAQLMSILVNTQSFYGHEFREMRSAGNEDDLQDDDDDDEEGDDGELVEPEGEHHVHQEQQEIKSNQYLSNCKQNDCEQDNIVNVDGLQDRSGLPPGKDCRDNQENNIRDNDPYNFIDATTFITKEIDSTLNINNE